MICMYMRMGCKYNIRWKRFSKTNNNNNNNNNNNRIQKLWGPVSQQVH